MTTDSPQPLPRQPRKPWLRGLAWTLGVLIGLPLVLVVAWVVSNLGDAAPAPLPAGLMQPAPAVPASENRYFELAGLRAPDGQDTAAWARQRWQRGHELSALPAEPRRVAVEKDQQVQKAQGPLLPLPVDMPWSCEAASSPPAAAAAASAPQTAAAAPAESCASNWFAQSQALAAQRQKHAVLGARCEALTQGEFRFEEPAPPSYNLNTPVGDHVQALVACMRWFGSGAVLAQVQGQRDAVLPQLQHADRLLRSVQKGSHSVIGHMAWRRIAHEHLHTIAALAVRDAALAAPLQPLLDGWPEAAPAIRRWMVSESAYMGGLLKDVAGDCFESGAAMMGIWSERTRGDALAEMLCRSGFGLQTQRTQQRSAEAWLRRIEAVSGDWPAMLALARAERDERAARGLIGGLAWRNTIGAWLVDLTSPSYGTYVARHADIELLRIQVGLVLAAQAQGVPAAERASWMGRQTLPSAHASRLRWADDGRALDARAWQLDWPDTSFNLRRDGLLISWPQ